MADTEEYFPRGGKKPTTLFKQGANFLGAPEKSEKKKKKLNKKSEGDDGYLSDEVTQEIDQSTKNCAVGLSYQTIKEGVLVLGRVRYAYDTKLIVMLPCKLIGNVMACHISEPYNKLLEDYVNDKVEKVRELGSMFRPGQYIVVKVLEQKEKCLMLSTMPQHVYGGKTLADVVKGALFQAAVVSIEDHGFVMDLGVPNTTTFLPKKDVSADIDLDVGMVTWCAVKSVTPSASSSVVTVAATLGAVQGALLKKKPKGAVLPGSSVEFTVDTPLDNGIEGTIFGDTTCYVQRQHVDKVKGKKPNLGQKIRCRVLYVLPTRNTPFLTMKSIFDTTYPDMEAEQALKDGDIVEEAQVLKIIGRSVHFKLGRGNQGMLSLKRIQVDEELADEEVVAKSYPLGSKHRVRVLCYNLSDYVYSVTDQPHIVEEPYFSLQQLRPGQLVSGTVSALADSHAELTVGRVKGFVPQTHLTETGVFVDPKKARTSNITQKKYKVGQKVQARVLALDTSKQTLILTLKPSLLAPELEPLQSYESARVGHAYTGVIRTISRDYLLVSFFNNVVAFVPRHFVTPDKSQSIADAFHLGQTVSCTILNVKLDVKKMTGSLTTAPFNPDENRPKGKRKQTASDSEPPQKKNKSDKQTEENIEEHTISKKKKRNVSETSSDKQTEENIEEPTKDKKKKRNVSETSNPEEYIKSYQETPEHIKEKRKKVQEEKSEESDAIETDVYEEEDVLTPHEQGLLDTSDCTTAKDFKKRLAAISKAIAIRLKRSKVVDEKITHLEDRGLNSKNKKYHTAMQNEKLMIEERIKKLADAIEEVKDKLKEQGYERNDSYKEEQKKRKQEKRLAKKQKKTKETDSESEEEKEVKEEREEKEVKKDKKEKKDKSSLDMKSILKDIKVVESTESVLEVPSAKDFFFGNAGVTKESVQEEESSSSDEEAQEQPKKKRKKLSVADKLAKVRAEEERIRSLEAAAADDSAPRSVDQFERALLAQPASSQLWIAYMAFHLQSTELDKARAVARKALTTIPFREEQEKLNIWLALLNLEHRFGTKESQQKTLEEAIPVNEPYRIHSALLDIHVETGKPQELAALVDLMMRRYKREPAAYIAAGAACFRLGLVDKARQLMQKSLAVLEKKEHVSILVQFALLERKHGARERAEALFEQVLAVYPQRVDVCATYVDMLAKDGDVEQVRQVLDRMTSLKLPARKMKILYKKWVEVEERFGDEAHVETIRQRAMEFIEKAKF